MEDNRESEVTLAATWEGRMRQVANCELPYKLALRVALECVEVAERYSSSQPQSMSPAVPDANLDVVVNLASALECDVRLGRLFAVPRGQACGARQSCRAIAQLRQALRLTSLVGSPDVALWRCAQRQQ